MEKLKEILSYFEIPNVAYQFKIISNGLINDTFLVNGGSNSSYILQKINTSVFENVRGLVNNLSTVLPVLQDTEYAAINLIQTKKGTSVLHYQKEVWRLMNYIPESQVFNTTKDVHIAFETGNILGLFHDLVKHVDPKDIEITLENFHNPAYRYRQFLEAIERATADHLRTAQPEIEFVKRNMADLLSIEFDKLPIRICHNDTKLNNVLFSQDKKALCLIDLDTIMPGYFLYDFGDAIRTLVNPAAEDERDLSLIDFDPLMFTAFLKGIQKSGLTFTSAESETMHLGAVLMPFLHGLRALTDYLENNRYYKVTYETQNLDRCKSLFRFAQLAMHHSDFMKEEIKKYFEG